MGNVIDLYNYYGLFLGTDQNKTNLDVKGTQNTYLQSTDEYLSKMDTKKVLNNGEVFI